MGVVFLADTRFNPELIKASQGARLLIHGAFRTDEEKNTPPVAVIRRQVTQAVLPTKPAFES